jgi:hypothetical protein
VRAHVAHQVAQHLAQPGLVGVHQQGAVGVDREGTLGLLHAQILGGVPDEPADVDVPEAEFGPLVEAGEGEQFVDEPPHAVDLAVHPVPGASALARVGEHALVVQLEVAAYRGQRGAQLVRGVADEAAQLGRAVFAGAVRGFDLVEHGVEGDAELFDLQGGLAAGGDAPGQVALGDRRRGLHHVLQRPHPAADAEHRQTGEQRQQQRADGEIGLDGLGDALVEAVGGGGEQDVGAVGEPGRRGAVVGALDADVVRFRVVDQRARVVDRVGEGVLRCGRLEAEEADGLAPVVDGGEERVGPRLFVRLLLDEPVPYEAQHAQRVDLPQGELRTAQRVPGLGELRVDLVQQVVPHAHHADRGRRDDAEREQRHVRQRELAAQRVDAARAVQPGEPHASPYPTPRRVVITGGPRASSLRRR